MEISAFNILILVLLTIAVSVVISMNVMNMVEQKMSDISINVPQPQCPKPTVLIRTENGEIVKVELVDSSNNNGTNVEGFNSIVGKNDLTDLVSDNGVQSTIIATDSNKPRIFLRQGYHTTPSERNMVNRDDAIRNPRYDDILRYNGPGCFENASSERIRRVQLVDEPAVDKCKTRPQIAAVNTGRRLTLSASGEVVDQHVNYYVPQTYLGAAGQRSGMPTGFPALDNIARTSGEPADVDQIGAIPVNNFEGEPVPIGSILME
jgi:hypothetical protein